MRIQRLEKNKIRIILESNELECNNITINSFLANSESAQKFISNLISNVNYNYNFSQESDKVIYDIFSLNNKIFIIVLTNETLLSNTISSCIFYKFKQKQDANEFISIIQTYLNLSNFSFAFYELNKNCYIKIEFTTDNSKYKKQFINSLLEFKTPIIPNDISIAYFNENSTLLH